MKAKASEATVSGHVFLVLELVHDRSERHGAVAIVASIPGREGTLTRRWKSPWGILDTAQLTDMSTTVARQVEEAVVTWTGSQGTLGV